MTNDQTQLLPFLVAPTIQLHPLIFGRSKGQFLSNPQNSEFG